MNPTNASSSIDDPQSPFLATVTGLRVARGVSDLHRDSERYEQQVRLLDGVASTTPDFVYLFDPQGRFLYANRRLLEVWGMKLADIVGKTCLELGYEQWHHDMHMREIAQVIATKRSIKGEVPFKAPLTGVFGVYEYIFTPVIAKNGEVESIAGTTRDVTDRKRTEDEIRHRGEQFQTLLNAAPLGVYLVDADFRLAEVNPIALPVFGAIPNLIGRNFSEVIHILWEKDYADEVVGLFRRTLETGEPYRRHELSQVRRDRGVIEYYEWRINRIALPDGRYGVVCYFTDISEQVQARQVIAESEAKYRELFASMTEGFCVIEKIETAPGEPLNFRYIEANPAFPKQSGLRDVVGKTMREVLPADADKWIEIYARVVSTGEAIRFERELQPQGRNLEVHAYRVGDGCKRQVGIVFHDITEQKRDERQLRRNHDTFYHLIQHNPFGVYVVDADFRLRQVSLGAQKVFSTVRPLLGRDFAEVLRIVWTEPFATEAINRFRHTLETGEPFTAPSTVERRHDIQEVESYDWRIERLTLPDGRFGVVCYFYDLSERQRWEAALRVSEERFQLAARATNDAIWDWDLTTNRLWWNEGMQTMFGYTADTIGAEIAWWRNNLHPEDRDRVVARIQSVISGRHTFWRAEYRFRRADGSYADVFDRGYAMRDKASQVVRMLGAMQDLSERKKAESALAKAQEELTRHAHNLEQMVSERTAALRETIAELETLSYSISHDMRAPLRAMQGFSQALLEDYSPRLDSEGISHLQRISGAAERLDSLIQDILLYTSVGRGQLELCPVPLEALIREVLQTYHPDQEARVTVAPNFPRVLGHQAFISQILSNLITNALKFVRPGEEPRLTLRWEENGDFVKVWVEDQGVGIAPQHLPRIFQVFGRVYSEAEYPGTGIGLSIVKRAVQKLGGEVGVESEPGVGSRFWFTLRKA